MPQSRFIRLGIPCVAVAITLSYFATRSQGRSAEDYKNVKTVGEAVELAQEHLKEDKKPEYAALLSEQRVRSAIRNAIESYEKTVMAHAEKDTPGTKEYFEKEIKPVCLQIADKGEWPAACSFDAYFRLIDAKEVSYDGMGLRLEVATPNRLFDGFSMPVLSLFYGRFEPVCE